MPKPKRVEGNLKISRITPPERLIASYSVLGGKDSNLLLSVDELTDLESKYLLCTVLDNLKLIGTAIETGNLQNILKSLEGLKKFQAK